MALSIGPLLSVGLALEGPRLSELCGVRRRKSQADLRIGDRPHLTILYFSFCAETSDHSDIESRVRRLRDQLELRKREVKRLYNERKKQRKAMLRAQEASLRQELQVSDTLGNNVCTLKPQLVDSTPRGSNSTHVVILLYNICWFNSVRTFSTAYKLMFSIKHFAQHFVGRNNVGTRLAARPTLSSKTCFPTMYERLSGAKAFLPIALSLLCIVQRVPTFSMSFKD